MFRRTLASVRFGSLRRTEPLSAWGSARGLPIDRWYIERFLSSQSALVQGRALEVKSDMYASRFGAADVEVVDIDAANPKASIVGDICRPGTLEPGRYDVAVVTQTLQLLESPTDAIRLLLQALRPGGTLLVTVPTLSRIVNDGDRWRWTPSGLRDLLGSAAPTDAVVHSDGFGNVLAARAFLFGLAAEDISETVLARSDPNYPLVVGGTVRLASRLP